MEAQLSEAGTFPAQVYAESFFAKYPTDARFLQCTYQRFVPSSSIEGKTIEFNLDRYDAANVYLIQDTNIEVTVQITKNDGNLPAKGTLVGVTNNLMHTLFESVRLTINDLPITVSPNNYPYKAYISNCLTYSASVKAAQLACQGWYTDLASHMDPSENNTGWGERCNLFKKTMIHVVNLDQMAQHFLGDFYMIWLHVKLVCLQIQKLNLNLTELMTLLLLWHYLQMQKNTKSKY